jgi:hypothetical protein
MSELLVQVREKAIEAVHIGDIKALYEILETNHNKLTDEIEQGLYGNILDLSLENLTDVLEKKEKLSLEDEKQKYTLRALYEYSISQYSAKHFYDAKALFEVLEGTCEDAEFSKSMKIHAMACKKSIDIDDFLDKFCEVSSKMDDFYIKEFKQKAQELLKDEKIEESK